MPYPKYKLADELGISAVAKRYDLIELKNIVIS